MMKTKEVRCGNEEERVIKVFLLCAKKSRKPAFLPSICLWLYVF
jgi:hypothetical protein